MKHLKNIILAFFMSLVLFSSSMATVSSEDTPRVQYTANGITTNFPITFTYVSISDVHVYFISNSTGLATAWTKDASGPTGYTVSAGAIVANTAPSNGYLVAVCTTPVTQLVDVKPNRALTADTLEGVFDKLTLIGRDLKGSVSRALIYGPTYTGSIPYAEDLADEIKQDSVDASVAAVNALTFATSLHIDNLAALRLFPGGETTSIYLDCRTTNGDGGQGTFVWSTADLSAKVAADPLHGIYVAPTSDPTGKSGAWVRQFTDRILLSWFGTTSNAQVAWESALYFSETAKEIICESSRAYALTSNLDIVYPIKINLNNSSLNFNLDAQVPGFAIKADGVEIANGTINAVGSIMGGGGSSLSCITSGNQTTGAGFKNIELRNLSLSTNRTDAGATVTIFGDSHNILIENINVPDNANCRNVIGCEWGGTSDGTGHPHDIIIRNITIGKLTYPSYGSSGYGFGVWLSGCFNVSVDNLMMEQGYGLVMAIRGDNANEYAPAEYKDLVGTGITVNNAVIQSCYGIALRSIGSWNNAVLSNVPMNVSFENITVVGGKIGANTAIALATEQSKGVTLKNFKFSGSLTAGVSTGTDAHDLVIKDGSINDCELYAISLGNNAVKPVVSNVAFHNNNRLLGSAPLTAAITGNVVYDALIDNCSFGIAGEAETQKHSIYFTQNARRPKLYNNYTHAIAASGVSYVIETQAYTEIEAMGINNLSANGITNSSGAPIFLANTDGTRSFRALSIPVSGTYKQGDIVYFSKPTTYIGAICTVAGTPGTWKTFGAITP